MQLDMQSAALAALHKARCARVDKQLRLPPCARSRRVCAQFFQDTEVELRQPRPGGFPPSGIWGYRVSNVALNLLNYFWFAKIAAKALQMVAPRRKAKSRAGKIC